jgi:predicted alpha/beta hydrolase
MPSASCPSPQLLRAAYVVAVGAGWHGWMPWPERLKVQLMWHGIGPLTTAMLGYTPLKRLGVGEDLPASIYRQWKRWCSFAHYFFDDPRSADLVRGWDAVTMSIAAANALDDAWAMPASREAFFQGVRHAPVQRLDIDPAADGLQGIGHMGYFRPEVGAVLWPRMLGWLQQQGLRLND